MSRKLCCVVCLASLYLFAGFSASFCQSAAAPQTARQALLEMFFSKSPGTMEKHLPEVLRAALHKAGSGGPMFDGLSMWTGQLQAHGQGLQTFEAGSTLLILEDSRQNSKFEVVVEHDDLRADQDDIELSFHAYKNGESQTSGLAPSLTFTMKQEAGVWRLNEISVTVKVSLTDPGLLKAIANRPPAASIATIQPQPTSDSGRTAGASDDTQALSSMKLILAAENSYAQRYPATGYTCSLPDMGGMGGAGEASEHQARILNPRLASGRKDGYVFELSGCKGDPVSSFELMGRPVSSGQRAFCSDESGVIRYSADGSAASCLSAGSPISELHASGNR